MERSHDDVVEQRLHTASTIREADGLVVGEVAALECGAGVVVDGDLALEGGGDIEGSWLVGTGPTGTRTCLRPAGLLGDGSRRVGPRRCGRYATGSRSAGPIVTMSDSHHAGPGRTQGPRGRRAASNVGRIFVVTAGSLALSPARCRGPESTDRVAPSWLWDIPAAPVSRGTRRPDAVTADGVWVRRPHHGSTP